MMISNLYKRGFSCDICGTGRSFPERLMTSILDGNGIIFQYQYSPPWAQGYKYDYCILDKNIIIETHGIQHYQDSGRFSTNTVQQQEIDKIKKRLAQQQGFQYYEINCSCSTIEYIENSIATSGLVEKLNLHITNEQKIRAYRDDTKSLCWRLYDEGNDIHSISKVVHHDIRAVREYLKTGAQLGLCTYQQYRKLAQVDITTGNIENIFEMIKDASECLNVPRTTISRWCNQGGKIIYKDKYKIIWLDEYDKYFP